MSAKSDDLKIRRSLSQAKYRAKNIDKLRIDSHKYWLDNKDLILEKQKVKYAEHKDMYSNRNKVYRDQNKDQILANQKKYASTEKGKVVQRIAKQMRRARVWKADKVLTPFDKFCFLEAIELCKHREVLTKIKWHIDHIVPISKGGSSGYNNIQVVPAKWNQSKSNRNTNLYFTKQEVVLNDLR